MWASRKPGPHWSSVRYAGSAVDWHIADSYTSTGGRCRSWPPTTGGEHFPSKTNSSRTLGRGSVVCEFIARILPAADRPVLRHDPREGPDGVLPVPGLRGRQQLVHPGRDPVRPPGPTVGNRQQTGGHPRGQGLVDHGDAVLAHPGAEGIASV